MSTPASPGIGARAVALLNDDTAERLLRTLVEGGPYELFGSSLTRKGDGWRLHLRARSPLSLLGHLAAALDRIDPTQTQNRTTPGKWLGDLGEQVAISSARRELLDASRRTGRVEHVLTLHRKAASADDVRAMLDALTEQGMPGAAEVRVEGSTAGQTLITATWGTGPALRGRP